MRGLYCIFFSLVLAACTQPELNRRYASLGTPADIPSGQEPLASFSVTPLPVPPSPARTITALSDKGQAAYIEALAAQKLSPAQLRAALAEALSRPASLNSKLLTSSRRLAISILKEQNFEPGDRIHEMRLTLNMGVPGQDGVPANANAASFANWNRIDTQYQTVDLGSIRLERGIEGRAEIAAGLPGVSAISNLGGSITGSRAVVEEQNQRQRYVALSGRIRPSELTVYMEGINGIDLVGTATADISVRIQSGVQHEVYSYSAAGGSARLSRGTIRAPRTSCPVYVHIGGQYTVRKILGDGRRTTPEGDDHAVYLVKNIENAGPMKLLTPGISGLTRVLHSNSSSMEFWVEAPGDPDFRPALFRTFTDGLGFARWVSARLRRGQALTLPDGTRVRLYDAASFPPRHIRVGRADADNVSAVPASNLIVCPRRT